MFKTSTLTEAQVSALRSSPLSADFWRQPRVGGSAEVMVRPKDLAAFRNLALANGIATEVKIQDVEK